MLRKLTKDDLHAVYRLTSQEEVARYMRFDTHRSLEEAQELLEEYLTRDIAYAIEVDGKFAGVFVLKPEENGTASVSTYLDIPYWNQGHMTAVLDEAILLARDEWRLKRLLAYVVNENTGSKRALEKNGFHIKEVLQFPDLESGLVIYQLEL